MTRKLRRNIQKWIGLGVLGLLIMGVLIFSGQAVAPFIYTLF